MSVLLLYYDPLLLLFHILFIKSTICFSSVVRYEKPLAVSFSLCKYQKSSLYCFRNLYRIYLYTLIPPRKSKTALKRERSAVIFEKGELQNASYYRFLHFPYSGHRDKFTNDVDNTFSLCCRLCYYRQP